MRIWPIFKKEMRLYFTSPVAWVIMAVFLFYGIFLQLMNLVVDLLYGTVDPRIRFGRGD